MAKIKKRCCAYCGTDQNLTREHILPDAINRKNNKELVCFHNGKILNADSVKIKDVCQVCNNTYLSILDTYGSNFFYEQCYFNVKKKQIELNLEFDKLVRWLLKLSYNAARSHNDEQNLITLKKYRKYILGMKNFPHNIMICCGYIDAYGSSFENDSPILRFTYFNTFLKDDGLSLKLVVQLHSILFLIYKVKSKHPLKTRISYEIKDFCKQSNFVLLEKNHKYLSLKRSNFDVSKM